MPEQKEYHSSGFFMVPIAFLFSLLFVAAAFWVFPYMSVLPAVTFIFSVGLWFFVLYEMRLLHVIRLFKGNTDSYLLLDVAMFLLFFFSIAYQHGYFFRTSNLPQQLWECCLRCCKKFSSCIVPCVFSGTPEGMPHDCLGYFCCCLAGFLERESILEDVHTFLLWSN